MSKPTSEELQIAEYFIRAAKRFCGDGRVSLDNISQVRCVANMAAQSISQPAPRVESTALEREKILREAIKWAVGTLPCEFAPPCHSLTSHRCHNCVIKAKLSQALADADGVKEK